MGRMEMSIGFFGWPACEVLMSSRLRRLVVGSEDFGVCTRVLGISDRHLDCEKTRVLSCNRR